MSKLYIIEEDGENLSFIWRHQTRTGDIHIYISIYLWTRPEINIGSGGPKVDCVTHLNLGIIDVMTTRL